MKNILINENISNDKYWNLITSTLLSYEEKKVSKDGTVKTKKINDDYFLVNNSWNVSDLGKISNFQTQYKNYKGKSKNVVFSSGNQPISLELKFVFYCKLFNGQLSLYSFFENYQTSLNKLAEFLGKKYPNLSSLLKLDIEKVEKEWTFWLNSKEIKTTKTVNDKQYGKYEIKSSIAGFMSHIYNELLNLTDTREEWEKERWDVRILNKKFGISYNNSLSNYYIDFNSIKNTHFKASLKKYIKTRLLSGKSFTWGTARNYLIVVPRFLNFISEINSEWNDLKKLSRNHIERYLEFLRECANNGLKRKDSNPKSYIYNNIKYVYTFLQDIQRLEYNIAPEKSSSKLLYPEDYPTLDKKSDDDIDYIPDYVLDQLFKNINELHPDVQAIVWVSFKTGLRISDTLGLTQDCLVKLNGKFSIVTDIEKTYVKGHKIPIDEELANIIAVLINNSKQLSNDDNNPNKYIFVRYSGSRKGKPFDQKWIQKILNNFAVEKNITDELGEVFHFKIHQFRHTYAIKMINGGADILTVQELMAHASPVMTLRYARLLDDTKRKAFEKVIKQGVFSFDLNGQIHEIPESEDIPKDIIDMMWQNEKLNALDNPYGSCRARINGNCPLAAEPPCLTANNGKPCFDLAVGVSDMDVKKYEIHIESTTKMIETAKQFGREDMAEANQKNLDRYKAIYETIKSGSIIFGRIDRVKKELDKKGK